MRKQRVHNPRYLEKFFTMFPNIVDDSELTPFEFRLLIHFYRVGECWEGVRKTSEICCMSTGKVADCRRTLEEKGFIRSEERGDGVIIFLVDLSKKNLEKYTGDSVQEVNATVQEVNAECSPGEHKKNQYKKNQLRRTESSKEDSFISPTVESDSPTEEEGSVEHKKGRGGKKAKKAEEPPEPALAPCRDLWIANLGKAGWKYGRDDAAMKECLKTVRTLLEEAGTTIITPELVVAGFTKVFLYAKEKGHWAYNGTMANFNAQFQFIFNEMRYGKKAGSDYQRRLNEADAIRRLPEQDF